MINRQGFTLAEIVVVMIIIGVVAVIAFPNFSTPTKQAQAVNAQNNLLAIYGAEQNYNSNYGIYPLMASLTAINTTLSVSIQDDGSYTYNCPAGGPCTANSTNGGANLTLTLNAPISVPGGNPTCSIANLCP